MEELGRRIAQHRKRMDMTQTELGDHLNVTAQAVSKWEKGLSDPDLNTLNRMSKLFGVSVDELISGASEPAAAEPSPAPAEPAGSVSAHTDNTTGSAPAQTEDIVVPAPAPASSAPVQAVPAFEMQPRIVLGYCHSCKKPLYATEDYVVEHGRGSQTILCLDCKKERDRTRRRTTCSNEQRAFKRSMIWGPIAGVLTALLFVAIALLSENLEILWCMLLGIGAFTFTAQCFWQEWMFEFMAFFFRSFRMPGVIFTLDLDGIVWFILVKVFLGFLSCLLSGLLAAFGVLLSFVVSVVTFPFALPAELRKINQLKEEADR